MYYQCCVVWLSISPRVVHSIYIIYVYTHAGSRCIYATFEGRVFTGSGEYMKPGLRICWPCMYMNTMYTADCRTGVLRMFPYLHMFGPLLWECCQCCACARQGSHVPIRWLWPTMHMALTVFYGCPSSQLIPVGVFEHSKVCGVHA